MSKVKIVLLGDSGVGKSSLALRFVCNEFRPYSEATIGASFMSKSILISEDESNVDSAAEETAPSLLRPLSWVRPSTNARAAAAAAKGQRVHFQIWDTAGQEKYHSLAPMYYRGAGAAVLVYDICSRVTYDALKMWVQELERSAPKEILLVLCGNKHDLDEHRQVEEKTAAEYAESVGAFYIETSARDDTNVQHLFKEIGTRVQGMTDCDIEEENLEKVNLGYSDDFSSITTCMC